jgi:hypothetical protein
MDLSGAMVLPRVTLPRVYFPRVTVTRIFIVSDTYPHCTFPRIVLSPIQNDSSPPNDIKLTTSPPPSKCKANLKYMFWVCTQAYFSSSPT